MDEKLDKKLCEDFPLLFADRRRSMQETCMCWGFSCGRGWEPIIRRLGEKLEPMIEQWIEDHPFADCDCGCTKEKHIGECQSIFELPRWHSRWRPRYIWKRWFKYLPHFLETWIRKFYNRVWSRLLMQKDKLMYWLCYREGWFRIYREEKCKCKGYHPQHPRAAQVKEKFGTLRFYMDYGTEEMWALAEQAEKESEITCEDCGAYGILRSGGWIRTLCDDCEKHYQETRNRKRDD